jgi:hypothetical protein
MDGENIMRRNLFFSFVGSAVVCLGLAGVSEATGTVPRAFVSINGSDTNPCSAVQPCRSFNQALTVVEPGGEIVVQNSGGYSTGFTITQGVTIDAGGFNASVISTSTTTLCTINTGPTDRVVLRGISFHGANVGGDAIGVTQVGSLYVEHCSMAEFLGDGVHMDNGGGLWMTDTDVRSCANGISLRAIPANNGFLFAQDSRFTECSNIGVLLLNNGAAIAVGSVSNCTASFCSAGFASLSNSSGDADLTLINCRAFGCNSGFGASTFSSGNATIRIGNCVATRNNIGISKFSSGGGVSSVVGTSPGTNFISGNGSNGSTNSSVTLQ